MSVMRVEVIVLTMLVLGATSGLTHATSSNSAAGEAQCEALGRIDFSGIQDAPTQITEAKLVESKGNLPVYCRIEGYIAPQVGIGLELPLNHWNGKFLEAGCGGNCGELRWDSCNDPLRRGYACIVTDMGHTSTVLDGLWADNNLQAKVDFGFRATHVAAVAGKAIAQRYYSKAPSRSYFVGCSQGGRQGLVEAQRFPWDFDGIVAGSPPINISTGHWLHLLWRQRQFLGSQGKLSLSSGDVQLVHQAALAACDRDDGVQDRIISAPAACHVDPAALLCKSGKTSQCLTVEQVETVKRIYSDGVTRGAERISRGELPGTELHWTEWSDNSVEDKFRYLYFWPDPGPRWQASDIDFDRDIKRAGMAESLYGDANPDLRPFKAAGGKLLVYHGWADEGVSPLNTVDYYETVVRTLGGRSNTDAFFRLFMVPGMNHCTGGDGAFAIDYLSYLEAWVEKGQAPDKLVGAHVKVDDVWHLEFPLNPSTVEFSRPVYPYPTLAKFRGHGDSKDAANFAPTNSTIRPSR